MKDRRTVPPAEKLPAGFDAGSSQGNLLRDQETGLYTMTALQEFIRYEIDGGAQTERNERFVTPVCLVAIQIDALGTLQGEARPRAMRVVADAITKITRRSDRLARSEDNYVGLLRRTLARRARDFYAPHLTGTVVGITREIGLPTTLSFGIVSLTEHLVKSPDDMVHKAFVALEHARKRGPGSAVVYDLREMA